MYKDTLAGVAPTSEQTFEDLFLDGSNYFVS